MNVGKVNIQSFERLKENEGVFSPLLKVMYEAQHNNGATTLRMPVVVTKFANKGWVADLDVTDGVEAKDSARDAMLKLADNLERIATAIKSDPDAYTSIDIEKIS